MSKTPLKEARNKNAIEAAILCGEVLEVEIENLRADFWEGDATKRFAVKKKHVFFFSEKGEAIQ